MNCDGVSNLLSAYLDGELLPGELLRVEEHLRRCHACADEVDSLRQTVALVASLEEVEVPASFQVSLHERLVALGPPPSAVRRAPAAPAWQRNARRWAVPAAAAAAALAISISQFSTNGLGTGIAGPTGIYSVKDAGAKDQVAQGTIAPPPVVVKPTTVKDNPGSGNAAHDVTPSTPKTADPPPVTQPGLTDPGSGSSTATVPGDVPPVVKQVAQNAYSFEVTVTGVLDQKAEDLLVNVSSLREKVNNNTMRILMLPFPEQMDQTQKRLLELYPGAVIKASTRDLASDIRRAELARDEANHNYETDKLLKAADEQLALDLKAVKDAEDDLTLLTGQVKTAVFTIQFQPAQ